MAEGGSECCWAGLISGLFCKVGGLGGGEMLQEGTLLSPSFLLLLPAGTAPFAFCITWCVLPGVAVELPVAMAASHSR